MYLAVVVGGTRNSVVVQCLESETGEGGLAVPAVLGSLVVARPAVVYGSFDLELEWAQNGFRLLSTTLYQSVFLQFLH